MKRKLQSCALGQAVAELLTAETWVQSHILLGLWWTWWTQWHWDRLVSRCFHFSAITIIPSVLHIHILMSSMQCKHSNWMLLSLIYKREKKVNYLDLCIWATGDYFQLLFLIKYENLIWTAVHWTKTHGPCTNSKLEYQQFLCCLPWHKTVQV
jgi:hypothetical protein